MVKDEMTSTARLAAVVMSSCVAALTWGASRSPAQESKAAEAEHPASGEGLVVDYPVFTPVVPPAGYLAAVRNGTRSDDGRPGAKYWQQRVDYRIQARLEPATAVLSGRGTITVRNETPHRRESLVLRLYQNVFRQGTARNRSVALTGGMKLEGLSVDGVELEELPSSRFRRMAGTSQEEHKPGYRVAGTLATIELPEPLEPGALVQIEAEWSFIVSGGGGFRQGHLNHEVFNLAQWYPQVAVFDDVFGQDRSPYLGLGEFYDDYGDFEVSVTVPEGWLVVGTGTLQNPDEVMGAEAARRLASAAASDTVIQVISSADRDSGRATTTADSGELTWRFTASSVRDFAFAASDKYVLHATGAETGHAGERALIQNAYDPVVEHWAEATLYAKHAIEFFSDYVMPYPYPQATTAYGPPQVGGMEYPMITFIARSGPGRSLNSVVSHELSHFWMPMIVGSKEMAYAWMDEGFTTYNNSLSMADYYDTEPQRPGRYEQYLMAARVKFEVPIMEHADYTENLFRRELAAYTKPAMLMHVLRHMLGVEKFDAAYRKYATTWAFKHPMPWDFFAMMEEAAGADLDWFWQAWYYHTATLDQAIDAVSPAPGGIQVTVTNLSDAVLPVELGVELADGSNETIVWPASVWAGTRTVTRDVPVAGRVSRVTIDPGQFYPDTDRSNNEWTPSENWPE
jgi:hypothetical protein